MTENVTVIRLLVSGEIFLTFEKLKCIFDSPLLLQKINLQLKYELSMTN
jgi:hypothetical protein